MPIKNLFKSVNVSNNRLIWRIQLVRSCLGLTEMIVLLVPLFFDCSTCFYTLRLLLTWLTFQPDKGRLWLKESSVIALSVPQASASTCICWNVPMRKVVTFVRTRKRPVWTECSLTFTCRSAGIQNLIEWGTYIETRINREIWGWKLLAWASKQQ